MEGVLQEDRFRGGCRVSSPNGARGVNKVILRIRKGNHPTAMQALSRASPGEWVMMCMLYIDSGIQ